MTKIITAAADIKRGDKIIWPYFDRPVATVKAVRADGGVVVIVSDRDSTPWVGRPAETLEVVK